MANFNLNDYETVDSRIKRFYTDHPTGRINTDLVSMLGDTGKTRWVVKAAVWRDAGDGNELPDGTGYAFENDGEGMANKTSALENGETSAIGRALANIGYSGDKRASREEMTKAQSQQPAPAKLSPPEGWRDLIAGMTSAHNLQVLYDTQARFWFTDDVRKAFSLRKEAIIANPR